MANINKIRLSGQTYNIEDVNASKTVELTQAQYDALTVKDPNTFYVITDAQGADLSNYYTKSETSGATQISTALGNKQDTLVSGTNIKTINNENILGSGNIDIQGGGKAVSGGTNISITTGETADTINCTLPITATTNDNLIIGDKSNSVNDIYISGKSIVFGRYSKVKAYDSLVGGYNCSNEKGQSQAFGNYTKTKNLIEFGCGKYNNSVSGSSTFGDSGNTLFSVGNGTANNARHNAFEIRQNGDIYLTKDGQDVKLQDQLGGSSITVDTAFNSGSTNPVENRVIYNKIDEVEQVTAAGLNALNEAISGKADTSAVTESINAAVSGKVDTSTFNTYSGSVETALSGKQDTLSAGTNITIVDNVISATGGGGKAIEAGRGISITTGETADTVSFNLPISAGTGTNSVAEGYNTKASGHSSHAEGYNTSAKANQAHAEGRDTTANGNYSHAEGEGTYATGNSTHAEGIYTIAYNEAEHASGQFNNSVKASRTFGNSGNTLFSVGNGTSNSARHNAFEIRQNGDIYLTKDGQDVKLQDQLGGGGGGITSGEVQTMIDESVSGKANSSDSTYSVTTNIKNDGIYFTTLNKDGNQIDYSFEPQIRFQAPLYSDYNDGKVKISGVTAVTSASTDSEIPTAKAVNDKLGGLSLVKLTQAQYDALSGNTDSNTLYVIVN